MKILPVRDDETMEEASEMLHRGRIKIAAISKRTMGNSVTVFAIQGNINKIQNGMQDFTKKNDNVNIIVLTITESLNEVPTKQEL